MKKTNKDNREEFINSENGNKKLREKIWDWCIKNDKTLVLLEPGCFDGGIKRWGKKKDNYAVVYDYENTAEALAKDYIKTNNEKSDNDDTKFKNYTEEDAYGDAVDWIEYNTLNSYSCYNSAGIAPKFVCMNYDTEKEEVIAQ